MKSLLYLLLITFLALDVHSTGRDCFVPRNDACDAPPTTTPPDDPETVHWHEAVKQHTIEAYEDYLGKYPGGKYAAIAIAAIDELAEKEYWEEVRRKNSDDGYRQFLDDYPDSRYAAEARRSLDTIAEHRFWATVLKADSVPRYQYYLKVSLLQLHRDEANRKIAFVDSVQQAYKALYQRAIMICATGDCDSISTYKYRLNYFPDNKYIPKLSLPPELEAASEACYERKRKKDKLKPHAYFSAIAYSAGVFNLWYSGYPLTLRITNGYERLNLLLGAQFNYYKKEYDKQYWSYVSDESDNYDHSIYRISAYQLSFPLSLRLNFDFPYSYDEQSYVSISGIYNYNFTGRCFRERSSKFMNTHTFSLQWAIGRNFDNAWDIELFVKKDLKPMFGNRDLIYEYDDGDPDNDYKFIDLAIKNKYIIGFTIAYYFNSD